MSTRIARSSSPPEWQKRAPAPRPTSPTREIWIIGDTPKDIDAGLKIGVRVLAVATGRYSVAELQAHGPEATVATLDDPRVADLLG